MAILTKDIWERIAFYTLATESTFLGPPSGLTSLLLICNETYQALSFHTNTRLYALLFDFKFDTAAPIRRMSRTLLHSHSIAAEFKKRMGVLRRVTDHKIEKLSVEDIWTCYLMYLENDGKNDSQLLHANLHWYLYEWTFQRADAEVRWLEDQDITALLAWLWYMMCTRGVLEEESSHLTDLLSFRRFHDLLVYGFRLSSAYNSSESHVPFPAQDQHAATPDTHTIIHYSHSITLSAPIISSAAMLAWTARTEKRYGNDEVLIQSLPETRAAGRMGPTRQDMRSFTQLRIQLPQSLDPFRNLDCSYDRLAEKLFDDRSDDAVDELFVGEGSTTMDPDWYRLVSCHACPAARMRGAVYSLGSSIGLFGGRLIVPDREEQRSMAADPNPPPTSDNTFTVQPFYLRLREHHCFDHTKKLKNTGTDWMNAFWPKNCVITENEDYMQVLDSSTGQTSRYETYYPQGRNGPEYKTGGTQKNGTVNTGGRIRSSGVADILVTGDSGRVHDHAWGSFMVIGRIRVWDGLVSLLRIPALNQEARGRGRWIFNGYFHNQNLVGRWRETHTPAHEIGWQGSFVVTQINETDV